MEWVETTGRSIEEAKDAALDKLGIDETDAEFEVLEEPKLGLFGRVRAEARVRARVRPNRPRTKEVRRDRNRRGKSANAASAHDQLARTSDQPVTTTSPLAAPVTEPVAGPGPSSRLPMKGGRPTRASRDGESRPSPASARPDVSVNPQGATMDQDVPLQEQADVARGFLVGLLASFETDGKVEIDTIDEDTIELTVDGGSDLHLLIGPGGATLTAIQEITRRVVQRQTGARNGRLLVDVSGYRRKRKAALERFVQGVAEDVRTSGVAKALEPMHAADRKVVHDTVNGLDGVTTTSEGEDPRRRVVISPS